MNLSDASTQAGITSAIVFAGGLAYKLYRATNGRIIHSRCCDKDIELGYEIEDMRPKDAKPEIFIQNPALRAKSASAV